MKRILLFSLIIFICALSKSLAQISVVTFATGQNNVTDLASCGDDRIFVIKKTGVVSAFDSSGNVFPNPFLDITTRVNSAGLEKGLLGLTFAPDYSESGYFYVYYVALPGIDSRISRFKISSDPNLADTSTEQIIITIPQPVGSHFGGDLAFGKDGYLYLGLGDGGGEGDPSNHAQDTSLLLGKFLRIDVSDTTLAGYNIPPNNPFLSSPFPDEVWSVGFRNPWRWSFDRLTGDMWIGDVGQGAREEIDLQPWFSQGGENYGWRCYEGFIPYVTTGCAAQTSYVNPVHDYTHSNGCSVTGGFVYRGSTFNTMFGKYFYSDWCTSSLRMLRKTGSVYVDSTVVTNLASGPVCFTEDKWGEILIGLYDGTILRLFDATAHHHVAWISDSDSMLLCVGSAVLQTPPGYGFHYEWNFNGSVTGGDTSTLAVNQPGDYYVTVYNASGLPQVSDTVYVSFNSLPAVTISGLDTVYCSNTPAVPILASPLGGQLRIDGIVQTVFQFNPSNFNPGIHLVEYSYTNSSGCSNSYQQQVRVDACSFIDERMLTSAILFPVPSKDFLRINSTDDITIYDLRGELLNLQIDKHKDYCVVHTENLPTGFYFCRIKSENGVRVLKWMKN